MMRNIGTKNNQVKYIRQGDILLQRINSIDTKNLVEHQNKTLALGEMTGHHHSFQGTDQVLLFKKDASVADPEFLRVEKQATLTHQEHKTLLVPPGEYKIIKEQEYNPFEKQLTQVRD